MRVLPYRTTRRSPYTPSPLKHSQVEQRRTAARLAAPMGAAAVQMGTLVKLVRVLMLGPVVLCLPLLTRPMRDETDEAAPHVTTGDRPKRRSKPGRLPLHKMVPWFIAGFPLLAALGLSTDLRTVDGAGLQVTTAVVGSLAVLGAISLLLIRMLAIG